MKTPLILERGKKMATIIDDFDGISRCLLAMITIWSSYDDANNAKDPCGTGAGAVVLLVLLRAHVIRVRLKMSQSSFFWSLFTGTSPERAKIVASQICFGPNVLRTPIVSRVSAQERKEGPFW